MAATGANDADHSRRTIGASRAGSQPGTAESTINTQAATLRSRAANPMTAARTRIARGKGATHLTRARRVGIRGARATFADLTRRTHHAARAAVVRIAARIDAGPLARGFTWRTRGDAGTARARVPRGAHVATAPAVVRIGIGISARPTATGLTRCRTRVLLRRHAQLRPMDEQRLRGAELAVGERLHRPEERVLRLVTQEMDRVIRGARILILLVRRGAQARRLE